MEPRRERRGESPTTSVRPTATRSRNGPTARTPWRGMALTDSLLTRHPAPQWCHGENAMERGLAIETVLLDVQPQWSNAGEFASEQQQPRKPTCRNGATARRAWRDYGTTRHRTTL
jgi:hypothetical protein